MLKFKDLKDNKNYIAIGSDGKEYNGTFINKYFPGGVFFCCYPQNVELIGFIEKEG